MKIHVTTCKHRFHAACFKKVKTDSCPCCRASTICPSTIGKLKAEIKQTSKDYKEEIKRSKCHQRVMRQEIKWIKERLIINKKKVKNHCNGSVIDTSPEIILYGERQWLTNCHESFRRRQQDIIDYRSIYKININKHALEVKFYDDLMKKQKETLNVLLCN